VAQTHHAGSIYALSRRTGISKTAVRNYLEGGEPGITALHKALLDNGP